MRKFVFVVLMIILSGYFYAADFDTMTNEMASILKKGAETVSMEMKKHLGFYTGSGNIFPANTSQFLGLKFGLGGGVVLNSILFKAMSDPNVLVPNTGSKNEGDLSKYLAPIGTFPIPYNMIYGKVGLPFIDLDVGLRLGYFPRVDTGGTDYRIGWDSFHFGLEGRYLLWKDPTGLIKVDARLSGDFNYGNIMLSTKFTQEAYAGNTVIGTNENVSTFGLMWGGSSWGVKVVGGFNIPIVGSIYGGIGANLNFGAVNTRLGFDTKFKPTLGSEISYSLEGNSEIAYDLFDLRLLVGANIFFVNIGYEYNLLNGDMAVTIIPIALTF